MNNYQLYRSNTKLGGQVKWNLILDDNQEGGLYVREFDLTPISQYISYNYGQSIDILRYTHQENVRSLYKKIKGQFYEPCIDPSLKVTYPILGKNRNTKDKTLDMGCSRISYQRYRKQFQLFCPLWLEEIKPNSKITFILHISTNFVKNDIGMAIDTGNDIFTKSVVIDLTSDDRFSKYLHDYILYIGKGGDIGDDVMNINLTNKDKPEYGSVTGLHVVSGDIITKDITLFVPNLYERVRPMMEFDSLIIENFPNNELITKQLFNFNLLFNLSDILSSTILDMIDDSELNIYSEVIIDGKKLEKKDFYNNYDFIPNNNEYLNFSNITSNELKSFKKNSNNTFNYLRDQYCADFSILNKLSPDICHWSLRENNDYIFNLYPGFENKNRMFYKNMTNLWEEKYSEYNNVISWCKSKINISLYDIDQQLTSLYLDSNKFTTFNKSDFIIDNKYNKEIININNPTYLLLMQVNMSITELEKKLKQLYPDNKYSVLNIDRPDDNKDDYIVLFNYIIPNSLIIFVKNINLLSYKYIVNKLNIPDNNDKITELKLFQNVRNILQNIIEPKFIYMHSSLNPHICNSPWITAEEVYYTKDDMTKNIVIRYDGKIKPTFTDLSNNILYQVKLTTEEEFNNNEIFKQGIVNGIIPKYPSVGYYSLEPVTTYTRSYHEGEDQWYDFSTIYNLKPEIILKINSKKKSDGIYYTIDELVREELKKIYPILSENNFNYIYNLYSYTSDYEYENELEDNDFKYLYTIKLTLK